MLSLDIKLKRSDFELSIDTSLDLNTPTAILGANGSGKTTLLRTIAGLEQASGKIKFNDTVWIDTDNGINVSTRRRAIGYLTQKPLLFPHMDVESNLRFAEYVSQQRTLTGTAISTNEILKTFDLLPLRNKKTFEISGGELSRTALAQTLLSRPTLLLLDEPLASIDVNRKKDLIPYLENYLQLHQLPMLYVTHDISEVARFCPQSIVLDNGSVVSFGDSSNVIQTLSQDSIFESTDVSTLLKVKFVEYDSTYQIVTFKLGSDKIFVPTIKQDRFPSQVYLRIRNLDVGLARTRPSDVSIRNVISGTISAIQNDPLTPYTDIQLTCQNEQQLHSRITRKACEELQLMVGQEVFALIKSVSLEL